MLPATDHNEISNVSITATTYIDRLLSFSLSRDTRALLLSYFCFSAAALIFLGLYPTWVIADGLAGVGTRAVGTLLFLGGLGGLSGALLSGWLAKFFRHPLELCAVAAFATGIATLVIPLITGGVALQTAGYGVFSFGRALMLSLIVSCAMGLVPAIERGSLNATLNAIFQTASAIGGVASAWFYKLYPDFVANSVASAALFAIAGILLWGGGASRSADAKIRSDSVKFTSD